LFDDNSGIGDWPYSAFPLSKFRTSFETSIGDRWPDWTNDREYSANVTGSPLCRAIDVSNKPYHLDPHDRGWYALEYYGVALKNPTECNCYFRVFDLGSRRIDPRDTMIYWIYPVEPLGRFVGVDLVCTDGTSLRDSGAVDQNGIPMHPGAGHGNIPTREWSLIQCDIGRWLGGKTLDRMLVAFDQVGVQGTFRGYIDDIYIG
jgi:hypothetical protein